MRLVLRVEPDRSEAFTRELDGEQVVLGRSSKADLVVPDPFISRLQARVYRDGERWLIEHLGGRNPTLVNGRALQQPEPIAPGDLIVVSDTRIRVEGSGVALAPVLAETPSDSGQTLFRPATALIAEREARERRAGGGAEELGATGLPLGLLPTGDYERQERQLEPGDLVVLYTDGVSEAANPAGEEYGLERLTALARRHSREGVEALAAALHQDLDTFAQGVPFGDDRTFLLLRRL